ncbi:hypothetical protein TWF694_002940 [Orbilia ellipsospora]|uniref:Xylanolytic transcriptional activator regulatory domain-containing protein n=1 Tax=Orbilia ellipsospora TaxID=2528407 RepID=A0AAV9X099_9PEZI
MKALRSGVSLEDILVFIREDDNAVLPARDITPEPVTTDLTLLANAAVEAPGQTVCAQMSLDIVDDRPFVDLSASFWTTVTDDDEFVSHLISSWIAWDSLSCHYTDVDIFVEAMKQKDQLFCSSLLVNSVLATACHFSSRLTLRSDIQNPNSFCYRFLKEAISLWHEEFERPKPTTVQAGMMLCQILACNGSDQLAWMMFQTTVSLFEKLRDDVSGPFSRHYQGKHKAGREDVDIKIEQTIYVTEWAVFRLSSLFAMTFKYRPRVSIPNTRHPSVSRQDVQNKEEAVQVNSSGSGIAVLPTWRPYPYTQPLEPCLASQSVEAASQLCVIIYEFTLLITTDIESLQPITIKEKLQLYERLQRWKESLPTGLRMDDNIAPYFAWAK